MGKAKACCFPQLIESKVHPFDSTAMVHSPADSVLPFAMKSKGTCALIVADSCALSKPVNPTSVKRSTAACFVIVVLFLLLAKCSGGESNCLPEAKLLASI